MKKGVIFIFELNLPQTPLEKVLAVMGLTVGVVCMLAVAYYLVQVIAKWRVFTKAGEAGWKSIIPVYNQYITFKIAWKPVFFWLTLLLSFASSFCYYYGLDDNDTLFMALSAIFMVIALAISVVMIYKLSKAFGYGVPFTLGLLFLPVIFILILGFGHSTYKDADK